MSLGELCPMTGAPFKILQKPATGEHNPGVEWKIKIRQSFSFGRGGLATGDRLDPPSLNKHQMCVCTRVRVWNCVCVCDHRYVGSLHVYGHGLRLASNIRAESKLAQQNMKLRACKKKANVKYFKFFPLHNWAVILSVFFFLLVNC